jgi:hypothetical protein
MVTIDAQLTATIDIQIVATVDIIDYLCQT